MDYQKSKIYIIRNYTNEKIYIGSTCSSLSKRFYKHRSQMNCKGCCHFPLYLEMRELGVKQFYIELIEEYPCNNKDELRAREGYYIREYHSFKPEIGYNKRIEGRTRKEWVEDNNQQIKESKKEYYENNKEDIKQYKKDYQEKNKERIKEKSKAYQENNKEKIKQKKKEYNEKNKERIKQRRKEYYERNKEIFSQKMKKYKSNNINKVKEYKHQYYLRIKLCQSLPFYNEETL